MVALAAVRAPARHRAVPVAFALGSVAVQLVYPRVEPPATDALTMLIVVLFCAATLSHALVERGPRFALALLAVTAGGGLLVEAVGVATGFPFSGYAYADTLPPKVLGVPWVIPLAWTMMAYPALLVGRRISGSPVWGPVAAGAALAAWDLYLDPQMVAAGHWTWAPGAPALLGIPLTNYAGWLVTATLMMAALWRLLPARPADDRLPLALYVWTWVGSFVAHAWYLGLPGSAALGAAGMGAVVVALAVRSRS